VEGVGDGSSGEVGRGVEEVRRRHFVSAGESEEILNEGSAEVFTASGFGRTKLEIGILHEVPDKALVDMAATGEAGVLVKMLAAVGEVGDERVHEHVGGAGVEGEDLRGSGACRDDGDVGDAAEIEGDAAEFGMAIEEVVGEGN